MTVLRQPQNYFSGVGHPALRGNTNRCAVGAGYAPPAIYRKPLFTGSFVGAAYMPPVQSPGYCDISGKLHGTHLCVPYKPAGKLHFP